MRVMTVLCVLLAGGWNRALAQHVIGGCPVLPANNIWNTPVEALPVLPNSAAMVSTIGAGRGFHADFGSGLWNGGPIGIPFITVSGNPTRYPATFLYADESDPGPYAVPLDAPIEGGAASTGDRHALAIDTTTCTLYELYRAFPGASAWTADSGAIFDLRSHALRPATWTSADAAGLPIAPGLVTYEEVLSGEIRHAIRFTAPQTRREFVWPARHYASSLVGTQYPRMGERFRLRADFDVTTFPPVVQVILRAMKKYGIILADNGSAWYISGKPDERWRNTELATLGRLLGSDFVAVDATVLRISPDSGEARQTGPTVSVSPVTASVRVGTAQAFSATVAGATGGVTWRVDDVAGGSPTLGTIDTGGVYIALAAVPASGRVTISATSTAAPSARGSALVDILPAPSITAVTPANVTVGAFTLTVAGAGFVPGSTVWFDGAALATTFVSAGSLTASGVASSPRGDVPVVVRTPDGYASNVATVSVAGAPAVTVTVSPATANVRIKERARFVARVAGTSNTAVVWSVNGVAGGSATAGTITSGGTYRAPGKVPVPATVMITAASVADPAAGGTATVTIVAR